MYHSVLSEAALSPACYAVLQLSAVKGLGLKSFHQLHTYFGSSCAILNASLEELCAAGIKRTLAQAIDEQRSRDAAASRHDERLADWLAADDQVLICLEDLQYPAALREIFCPPPLLYAKGCLEIFASTSVAVVGSRRPTLSGQRYARRFAQQLAERNIVVTSGLAIGIDTYAHQGCLSAGGASCAVLGAGLDSIYPKQNRELAQALCEQGVLISEMALGVKALPANFPRRNRIISGLSKGVLVVEAGLKSGSLITAEFAVEQNRDVFAIPGPIDSKLSQGCHALLKQGAVLVEELDDILAVLGTPLSRPTPAQGQKGEPNAGAANADRISLEGEELRVFTLIGEQTLSFDELICQTQLDIPTLTNVLMSLELKGLMSSTAGGYHRC